MPQQLVDNHDNVLHTTYQPLHQIKAEANDNAVFTKCSLTVNSTSLKDADPSTGDKIKQLQNNRY